MAMNMVQEEEKEAGNIFGPKDSAYSPSVLDNLPRQHGTDNTTWSTGIPHKK